MGATGVFISMLNLQQYTVNKCVFLLRKPSMNRTTQTSSFKAGSFLKGGSSVVSVNTRPEDYTKQSWPTDPVH